MNIKFEGGLIKLSEINEENSDDTKLFAKFLICPLNEGNGNGYGIKEEDITQEELDTLINQPVVTKLIYDDKKKQYDFSGHLTKKTYKIEKNGNVVKFTDFTSTTPLGFHQGVSIEDVEIKGEMKRCIVADVCIWTRYYHAIEVIKRMGNNLRSSWELRNAEEYEENGVTWLKGIFFLANCLLGSKVPPAYEDAGLLEVAEQSEGEQVDEIAQAMFTDIAEQYKNSEKIKEDNMADKNKTIEPKEDTKTSSIEQEDLRGKIRKAIYSLEVSGRYYWDILVYPYDYVAYAKIDGDGYNVDDFCKFTFSVNSDNTISITSQEDVKMVFMSKAEYDTNMSEAEKKAEEAETKLSEKNDEIITLGKTIKEKEAELVEKDTKIAELQPYMDKVKEAEKAEQEAQKETKMAELNKMLVDTGYFTEEEVKQSEEIQSLVSELNEDGIKKILADKVVEAAKKCGTKKSEEKTSSEKIAELGGTDINAHAQEEQFTNTDWVLTSRRRRR